MNYWLLKSEPDVFSIGMLKRQGRTGWEGVRNYQARNYMRDQMKVGDLALFYHSNAEPSGIAGVMRVSKESHPDPTQFDGKSEYYDAKATKESPRWFMVEVEFIREFSKLIPLEIVKKEAALADFVLVQKGSRLSVMPVTQIHWDQIMRLEKNSNAS